MIKVQGERIKGFLYDSLETAQSDLEVNEVIVTNNPGTFVIIKRVDLDKVKTIGYAEVY
ncbi:hypothetical protein QUF84_08625 [Fictibacillus enclensis]|uniref:hypothetical protein n=1 Tax=Fictibacillus enclensis TaxID=1017270 RepID=UPI0025A25D71|nr:hypothetical protein [Fictibacillus enclensis]MDM5198137.1 hypothetical protein [Fictibacillus enclensis]MDM5337278.1 hypothetical protein [Fictibacillus enclensis]